MKQIIQLNETQLTQIITETIKQLLIKEHAQGVQTFQNYEDIYDGNSGRLYTKTRGNSPKESRHTYPAKQGLQTKYGTIDTDKTYTTSKNKMHMKQHKQNEISLDDSINNKIRNGEPRSKY